MKCGFNNPLLSIITLSYRYNTLAFSNDELPMINSVTCLVVLELVHAGNCICKDTLVTLSALL